MRRAIILGAGISGLVASTIANETCDQVVLIDRDFLGLSKPRRGVAQAKHLHVLLQKGRIILEDLFPGLDNDLKTAGALEIDWGQDTAWLSRFGWFPRNPSNVITRSCSRNLLEASILKRILSLKNLSFFEHNEAIGIKIQEGNANIQSVSLADGQEIEGDLFIDATGRTSHLLGSQKVSQTIDASIGYASCLMEIPATVLNDFKQLYIQMRPPQLNRGGVMIPEESGLHKVTLIGAGGDYPPTNERQFIDFARLLASPLLYQTICESKFASPITAYRRTAGHRILPRISKIPNNLFVLGDAHCAFNPVYGQGMTLSALTATILKKSLAVEEIRSSRFHSDLRKITQTPWVMGSTEDLRVATTKLSKLRIGAKTTSLLLHFLSDLAVRRSVTNKLMHQRFLRVLHMIDPPLGLFTGLLRPGYE